jgi:23S rRNA (guanine2445-N2)-methyltransferase / 23S rRNA (guanine2069-N7)-methyltransferase
MAAGGAKSVTTVDMSLPYLEWAQRNMDLNGFKDSQRQRLLFEQADVLRWLGQQKPLPANRYGLIFVDVPTFSNSSRMGGRTWDVQRDHVELLVAISQLLAVDGEAVFSTNLRSFQPDLPALAAVGLQLQDISKQTLPPDFQRTPKMHRCYLLRP